MPLNREHGETVEGMDAIFRVAPVEKWQAQTRLTTIVEEMQGTKFRRKRKVSKPIWEAALDHAKRCFFNSGAPPGPLSFDCIVQEYPRTSIVCFIFEATIFGHNMLVTAPFLLTPEQIADLAVRNLWQHYTLN
jgi:hypothetical protein